MSNLKEIDSALAIFKEKNCPFELMHSVSAYPAPEDQLNLNLIKNHLIDISQFEIKEILDNSHYHTKPNTLSNHNYNIK